MGIWIALGLLAIFIVLSVTSALRVSSEWDDIENMEEDDD